MGLGILLRPRHVAVVWGLRIQEDRKDPLGFYQDIAVRKMEGSPNIGGLCALA